jgi:Flp pilus assembly protein CpaB
MVLVAAKNLYKGTAATFLDGKLRAATDKEQEFMKQNAGKLFPTDPEAVHLRILAHNVAADKILLEDQFEPITLPKAVNELISPGMRAVDIELPKDRAASGLLRVGERVDVYLTCKVQPDRGDLPPRTAIAPIARNLKVIVKRGYLVTLMIPVPEDKPVSFIVEANPYRAALIEFAKTKGNITLVDTPLTKHDSESPEEQERVKAILDGKIAISEKDLEKIFHLPPIVPIPPPLKVEHLAGTSLKNVTTVEPDGMAKLSMLDLGYRFLPPTEEIRRTPEPPIGSQPVGPNNISPKAVPPAKKK